MINIDADKVIKCTKMKYEVSILKFFLGYFDRKRIFLRNKNREDEGYKTFEQTRKYYYVPKTNSTL